MESNLTTPSRPTNNWAPKSGSPTAHLRGCVEPHFVICLGNAHRPSIRQEYTPHHLASRIHDPGLCNGDPTLSGPVSASDHLASRIHDPGLCNGDPTPSGPISASGNHQRRSDTVRTGICPASPLYSEQSGYDKRELENGSRNVRAKGVLEVLAAEQYPVYKLSLDTPNA